MMDRTLQFSLVLLAWFFASLPLRAAQTINVASYNLEAYLDHPHGTWTAKSEAAKTKIREGILGVNPDVLALQEVGGTNELRVLRDSLKGEGVDFPYWEIATGFDTNLHVAILSKLPIVARRPHTNENFLLNGRRFRVTRGFVEVEIQANPAYVFTVIVVHLKSRRPVPAADDADLREQEALRLREIIDARLAENPQINLIVAGDLNDTYDSPSTKTVIGRGRGKLIDTRPAEDNGDNQPPPNPRFVPRKITWTHFYGKEDTYSRIDYLLLSPGMAREWEPAGTHVLAFENWGVASDHRPIVARFRTTDR
jgi:endonuclease/exonuclease/phosphatase family metal-dependent hydrolase